MHESVCAHVGMNACDSPVSARQGCVGGAPTPAARARRYIHPPLAFDTFMSYVDALGAVPYLVLNYDSGNFASGPNDWTYAKLLDLAVSWLSYIVRTGHKARRRPRAPSLHPDAQHAGAPGLCPVGVLAMTSMPRSRRACAAALWGHGPLHAHFGEAEGGGAAAARRTRGAPRRRVTAGGDGRRRGGAQVVNFEFSNESYLNTYNGGALAAQYRDALADWAPHLRSIIPDLRSAPCLTRALSRALRVALLPWHMLIGAVS
jgi:hypothetical protein